MPILGIIASSVQKAYKAFSDNFNRATSGSLGTSTSSGLWEVIRGTWFANISATTNDVASTYPIAAVTMTSEDVTASISTGQGSVLISSLGTVGSIASGNGTTGVTGFHWATITGMSSTAGISVGDFISANNGTGSLYGETPDFVEVTDIPSATSITYRIKGGTVPVAGTVTDIETRGKDGGSGTSLWITDAGNWFGVVYGRSIDTSCNCSQCLNGTYTCSTYQAWSSCGGWTSFCNQFGSFTRYKPDNTAAYDYRLFSSYFGNQWGYRLTGFTPGWTTAGTYENCASSSATCTGGSSSGTSCSASTQNSSVCNCQTCYPPYISVIKSVSNAVTEVSRFALVSMVSAFKVITNSTTKVLTIRPYKDENMTSQIGTDLSSNLSAASSPTKKFGIVLSPSDQIQGKNIDDFKIDIN